MMEDFSKTVIYVITNGEQNDLSSVVRDNDKEIRICLFDIATRKFLNHCIQIASDKTIDVKKRTEYMSMGMNAYQMIKRSPAFYGTKVWEGAFNLILREYEMLVEALRQ